MAGVPAIYFHSLFGSRGDSAAVRRTGSLRSINRQTPGAGPGSGADLPGGRRRQVLEGLRAFSKPGPCSPRSIPAAPQESSI